MGNECKKKERKDKKKRQSRETTILIYLTAEKFPSFAVDL